MGHQWMGVGRKVDGKTAVVVAAVLFVVAERRLVGVGLIDRCGVAALHLLLFSWSYGSSLYESIGQLYIKLRGQR
jgi:hypothetical protein